MAGPEHTLVLNVTPGEVLDGRWRIETRVGQGAMGSVYRGRDLDENRVVAIKILAPEHARKPKVLARFEREAELMTTLRHPNIVQLYGHGRRGVLPFIAMEYLEGLTLGDVVTRLGGTLALNETVACIKQIAAGLAFLHHHELVHRDVKPQNIFVVAGGRVTILDLGVVRDQANPGLTKPGAMVGTPYYMSPEQILGLEDIDHRTDVYALAAMTFELLTGRPPFLGSNNFEVLYGHRNTAVPDASTLGRSIPKAVAGVLARGMSKQRDARPESASEFAYDLEVAADAKRVELSKSFAFLEKKVICAPKSRTTARSIARLPSVEVPEANQEDVVSVVADRPDTRHDADPEASELNEPESDPAAEIDAGDTMAGNDDATFVGTLPQVREPPRAAATNTGTLRIVALSEDGSAMSGQATIDGQPKGPSTKPFTLTPGRHHVRLEVPGHRTVDRQVEIITGATYTLKLELELKMH